MAGKLDIFRVSSEMRTSAEKNVDQARTAFDDFLRVAKGNIDNLGESAKNNQATARDFASKSFDNIRQNVNAAFDLAKSIVNANDIQEASQLQAEFIRNQFGAMQAQAKLLTARDDGSPQDPVGENF